MSILKNIKEFTKEWKSDIKNAVENMDYTPSLAIIQVGDNEASNRYVKNKIKDCSEVGIKTQFFHLKEEVTTSELKSVVLDAQQFHNGVFVQLPLPKHIDEKEVIAAIDPEKDVDGFTKDSLFKPCTPFGIMKYLEYCEFDLDGKNVLVIGRSDIVGKPMARLLLEKNATVTIAHSHTKNLWDFINIADLIICAVGTDKFSLNCYAIHVPVVDVAIKFNEEGKLIGDCINTEYADVTPVPGGVGLLTRCALLENVIKAANKGE